MTPAIQKFLEDLSAIGFTPELVTVHQNQQFAVLRDYTIDLGRFKDKVIDLALPALPDYPRRVGQSIHVKANPQLLEKQHIADVVNIIDSPLGSDWLYWSFRLAAYSDETARQLMVQINGVFKRI